MNLLPVLAAAVLAAGPAERPWVDAEPGIKIGAPIDLAPSGQGPSIAPLGDGFVAAWLQPTPDGQRYACVVLLRLTAEGRPSGAPNRFECSQDIGPPVLAAGGGRVAMAWGRPNGIEARVLSPELTSRAEIHQLLPRTSDRISLSHDWSTFVLAWSDYDEAAALSFTEDGALPHDVPVQVDHRTSETDVEGGDVACAPNGVCAVLFRHFYGNSKTATGIVRLDGGRRTGSFGFGGYPGPFESKAVAAANQLLIFYSTYDHLWGESVLFGGNPRVFDYQTHDHRIRDIAGAIGLQGTLVAWNMEPRESTRRGTSIAYIHPDPKAARPYPLVIPGEISPAVATSDGRHFVVLTAAPGQGKVRARFVEVDPAKFGRSPAQRGPVLSGVVQDQDGDPTSSATVTCYLFLADGAGSTVTTAVEPDGRFSIQHPERDDLRAGADLARFYCWAYREDTGSNLADGTSAGNELVLKLQPPAPPARVRVTALSPSGEGRHDEDLQVLLIPGVRNQYGLHLLGKGRALELEEVAPGPSVLTLISPQGLQVTHQLQLQPGANHDIEVEFAPALPPGKVGLILDASLVVTAILPGAPAQRAGVHPGDVVVDVDGRRPKDRAQAVELLGGPPGTAVAVTVRRNDGRSEVLQVARTEPRAAAPPPRITVGALPAANAPPLILPGPGERVLAEAPVLPREEGGPFRADVDEAVVIPGTARVSLTFPRDIPQGRAIPLTATLQGPGDLNQPKQHPYYNRHTVTVGCDPVPGGGPDQCRNNTREEGASPPPLEFGPDVLNTPGTHRLTVTAPGFGQVRRTFLVIPSELGPAYQHHQQRQLGSYRLQARAAVRVTSGERPLTVYRALFRSGRKVLIVDVGESSRPKEELEAALDGGRWAQAAWVKARDGRAIKVLRRPDGFEAAWNADLLVRVAGAELGPAERAVIDAYLATFPSRRAAAP